MEPISYLKVSPERWAAASLFPLAISGLLLLFFNTTATFVSYLVYCLWIIIFALYIYINFESLKYLKEKEKNLEINIMNSKLAAFLSLIPLVNIYILKVRNSSFDKLTKDRSNNLISGILVAGLFTVFWILYIDFIVLVFVFPGLDQRFLAWYGFFVYLILAAIAHRTSINWQKEVNKII